jgi:hypothetical protein
MARCIILRNIESESLKNGPNGAKKKTIDHIITFYVQKSGNHRLFFTLNDLVFKINNFIIQVIIIKSSS